MAANRPYRTLEDLERTVRALATEFETDKVIIIGSQAVLVGWPDAPTDMTSTPEIDAYPGNAKHWQEINSDTEASEHINALFGYGSQFHQAHGFYIDGVDENTASFRPVGRVEQPSNPWRLPGGPYGWWRPAQKT